MPCRYFLIYIFKLISSLSSSAQFFDLFDWFLRCGYVRRIFYELKQLKMNIVVGEPKKDRTRVEGKASGIPPREHRDSGEHKSNSFPRGSVIKMNIGLLECFSGSPEYCFRGGSRKGGCRRCANPPPPSPPPLLLEMTCGFLIKLVSCKKKNTSVTPFLSGAPAPS